jgi:UDP-N-acetylglucosamine diphosphorylase/glucosamine-1-phosphate N-acetyltransferase
MTAVYLFDDARARQFEPFALTRPAGEMRAGALLVRERWEHVLGEPITGYVTSKHLVGFDEEGAAPVLNTGVVPSGSWLVNARFAPVLERQINVDALESNGVLAAVKLTHDVDVDALLDGTVTLDTKAEVAACEGWWIDEVWDYIRHLAPMLERDIPAMGVAMSNDVPHDAIRIGAHSLFVESGAIIEPSVCFDLTAGPVLIRAGAHVHAFTRLVGPLYVGAGSTVMGDKVGTSSIGDVCRVHGEVSNTIFLGYANKGHDGFVGHSILGRWVNLGAGTITSNLKNTYGTVQLWTPSGIRETGMQFLGTLFGDHAKTGIGLRLTTGSVLGAGANVYGSEMPPKAVAPFSWGEAGAFRDYRLDKFLDVAGRVMARRHIELSDSGRAQLTASYDARWAVTP